MPKIHSIASTSGSMIQDACLSNTSQKSYSTGQSDSEALASANNVNCNGSNPPWARPWIKSGRSQMSDQPEMEVRYPDVLGKFVSCQPQNTVVENMNKICMPDYTRYACEQKMGRKSSSSGSIDEIRPENIFPNFNMAQIDKQKQVVQECPFEIKKAGVQSDVNSTNRRVKASSTPSVVSNADSVCFDAKITRFLYNLWKKKRMCNLFFKVNLKTFAGHKVALAAHSDKYNAKFFAGVSDINTDSHYEINLLNTSEVAIKEVMRFMYTSDIRVNYQNVDEILCCARQLAISSVIQICKNFLINCSAECVLLCLPIARKHQFQDVLAKLENIACKNFNVIVKSHNFLQTRVDHIRNFVSSEQLIINSELDVLYAIINWIEFYPEDRMRYAVELMGFVRFVLIPDKELAAVFDEYEHIFQIPECIEMIKYAFSYHAAKTYGCHLLKQFTEIYPRMSQPIETNTQAGSVASLTNMSYYSSHFDDNVGLPRSPTVLAVGGMDPSKVRNDDHCQFVESYNKETNSWNLFASMLEPRHHTGGIMLDGYLYITGGSVLSSDDSEKFNKPTNSCFCYDPVNNSWASIAPLQQARMYHSVAILGNVLYAIGGQDENKTPLNTVEFYNPDTNTWRYISSMNEAKIGTSAVGHNGLLYVTGGYLQKGTEKVFLDTVECFNPALNTWIVKDPLPIASCHANLIVANDRIYHIGGAIMPERHSLITSLHSVLCYSEERDEWEHIQQLDTARYDAGATAIGSKIYIVGGLNSEEACALSSVECLDVETGNWQKNVTPLTHSVFGLSCCTLPGVDYYMER